MDSTLEMKLRRAGWRLRGSAAAIYDQISALAPARRLAAHSTAQLRRTAMPMLDRLSRNTLGSQTAFHRVLIDGMWDNLNYYFRYALLPAPLWARPK